jgi:hypothetical protein
MLRFAEPFVHHFLSAPRVWLLLILWVLLLLLSRLASTLSAVGPDRISTNGITRIFQIRQHGGTLRVQHHCDMQQKKEMEAMRAERQHRQNSSALLL